MKNQLKVEITEMFVAKADKDRVFYGCIKRSRNEKGEMNLFSRIAMPDGGVLCANESDQLILAKNLNSMAIMILDKNLHGDKGKYVNLNIKNEAIPYNDECDPNMPSKINIFFLN
jgi:hypothetical protein